MLIDKGFVYFDKSKLSVSNYGRAVSQSFLSIDEAEFIKDSLFNNDYFKDSDYIKNNIERTLHPSSIYYRDILNISKNINTRYFFFN